ncbi:MAG: phosphatase PAP2 family protein [Acidobacteria bacterium]|nr:phosphatase PAP2 family protein [Acidobacteriota bacterium]MBV9188515.1 phosphatase PAP2 family protein [Acidobacteriota bacterium]
MRAAPLVLFASSVGAFAYIAANVASGAARPIDEMLRRRIRRLRSPALDAVSAVAVVATAPGILIACSLAVAFRFRRDGIHIWLPIAASPLLAMTAGRCFTEILPQQLAPTAKEGEREPSFPSGHTTGAAAEMFAMAAVLRGAGIVSRPVAVAIALVPFGGGMNRLYHDRHWTTDIAAGLCAGTAIAVLLTTASRMLRPRKNAGTTSAPSAAPASSDPRR